MTANAAKLAGITEQVMQAFERVTKGYWWGCPEARCA